MASRELTVSPQQCRAARAWLDLSQQDLAEKAGIGLSTLRAFESGERNLMRANADALRRAIEAAGVQLLFEGEKAAGIAMADTRFVAMGPSAAEGGASAP